MSIYDRRMSLVVSWLLIAAAGACEPSPAADPDSGGIGALQTYLGSYGYLPNESLKKMYPSWRPVTNKLPTPGVLDETTRTALLALQRKFGLEANGLLDDPTRALISQARCGVPDNLQPLDDRNKFALSPNKWNRTQLRWYLNDSNSQLAGISRAEFRAAIQRAFATLLANTNKSQLDVSDMNPSEIDLNIVVRTDTAPCAVPINPATLACTFLPDGNDSMRFMFIDNSKSYFVPSNPSNGFNDLEALLLHEIGHFMGLSHSSLRLDDPAKAPVMHPTISTGKRSLDDDDKIALGTNYGLWSQLPGCATDIGTGNGDTWIIGCANRVAGSGLPIFKWNPTTNQWVADAAGGLAHRIAVTSTGIPWVVTEVGTIWRRTSSDPTTGSWQRLSGCAGEVGAGGGQVWITGCTASGGVDGFGNVFRWNGRDWEMIFDGVQGRAITADSVGRPIMTTPSGFILRRSTNSVDLGNWSALGGTTGFALDVAAISPSNDPTLSVHYAWAATVQSGSNIFAWDEQKSAAPGEPDMNSWFLDRSGFPGTLVLRVAAGKTGPWVVDSSGAIFRKSSEP